jgi:hypothetical protein
VNATEDCERVRIALAEGAWSANVEAHLPACTSCRFHRELSLAMRQVGGPTSALLAGGSGAPFVLAAAGLEPETRYLDRYRIRAFLGRGGQGCVWRAFDERMGDEVALKLFRLPDGGAPDVNLRRVAHENVCRVHNVERDGDVHVLVMDFIAGQPLSSRLGRLSRGEALAIFAGVCRGVAAMHAERVLHLDLKPENILLREGTPYVTDFGMSLRLGADGARQVARGGTAGYMAPEQAAGLPVDPRADVFSLGVLLRQLVPAPDARMTAAIARATAASRDHRFPTVRDLLATVIPPPRRRPARHQLVLAMSVGAVVIGAAAIAILPAPQGPRAKWRADLWGLDTVPTTAWNVARNLAARGLPAVATPHPPFACAREPWDLLDGEAQYGAWERGLAFAPPPTVAKPRYGCVAFKAIANGRCGRLDPDGPLCRFDPQGNMEVLPERGRDIGRFSALERENIGQVYRREECGDRTLDVALDGDHRVMAVRLWHHGPENTPRAFRAQVMSAEGRWIEVGRNEWAVPVPAERQATGAGAPSAPTTADFAPTRTRRVRIIVDTCSTISDEDLRRYRDRHQHPRAVRAEPGILWLYELEIFASVSKLEAWRRWLSERTGVP